MHRIGFGTAALLLCVPLVSAQQNGAPAPAVGETAPDIVGPDIYGKKLKLSDYKGKVVLLDFWGNW